MSSKEFERNQACPATNRPESDWEVWRQDDNGNRFCVQFELSEEQARSLVKQFEAAAHKQTYWAENPVAV